MARVAAIPPWVVLLIASAVAPAAGCAVRLPSADVPAEAARIPPRVRTVAVLPFAVKAGDRTWAARSAELLAEQLRADSAGHGRQIVAGPAAGRDAAPEIRSLEDALAEAVRGDADAVVFGEIDVAVVPREGGSATAVVWSATLIDARTREVYAAERFAQEYDPSSARPTPAATPTEPGKKPARRRGPFGLGREEGTAAPARPAAPGAPRTADEMVRAASAEFARRLGATAPAVWVPLQSGDHVFHQDAEEFLSKGRVAAAAEAFHRALVFRGRDAASLYNLGVLAEHAGDGQDALSYYEAAAAADRDTALYREARDRVAAKPR
jgi:hypothetical protein